MINVMRESYGGFRCNLRLGSYYLVNLLPSVCDKSYPEGNDYQLTCYMRQPRAQRITVVCRYANQYGTAQYAGQKYLNGVERS